MSIYTPYFAYIRVCYCLPNRINQGKELLEEKRNKMIGDQ